MDAISAYTIHSTYTLIAIVACQIVVLMAVLLTAIMPSLYSMLASKAADYRMSLQAMSCNAHVTVSRWYYRRGVNPEVIQGRRKVYGMRLEPVIVDLTPDVTPELELETMAMVVHPAYRQIMRRENDIARRYAARRVREYRLAVKVARAYAQDPTGSYWDRSIPS